MLKTCINYPMYSLCAFVLLLTGCGAFTGTTQPDVPEQIKLAYQSALETMKAGQHKQAISQFNKIVKSNPGLAGPYTNLGMLYLKIDSLDQAEQALLKAVELNPKNVIGYNYLGIVYRSKGRFDDAEKAYLKALEINSNYNYAHLNLGILYDLYKADLPKALSHYQKYLSLTNNPDKMVEKWIVDIKRRDTVTQTAEEKQG